MNVTHEWAMQTCYATVNVTHKRAMWTCCATARITPMRAMKTRYTIMTDQVLLLDGATSG